jgi:hypothetical protein
MSASPSTTAPALAVQKKSDSFKRELSVATKKIKSPMIRPGTTIGTTGNYFQKEKQDLSGHVCFDNELYEFYRTSELRANRIQLARMNGTLVMVLTKYRYHTYVCIR